MYANTKVGYPSTCLLLLPDLVVCMCQRHLIQFAQFVSYYRASCSPSQGPCCTTECTLKKNDKCRDDNGCRDPSYCDGTMPQCPPSVNKPNKTICNNEFVCFMGVSIHLSCYPSTSQAIPSIYSSICHSVRPNLASHHHHS